MATSDKKHVPREIKRAMTPKQWIQQRWPADKRNQWAQKHKFLNKLLHTELWNLNRRSVAGGISIGLFLGLLPIPIQMPLAYLLAIVWRVNLPFALLFTWISNPITWAPIFYANFKLGCWLLSCQVNAFETITWSNLLENLANISTPLFLGSFIVASIVAPLSYFAVRVLWRFSILQNRQLRFLKRNQD